VSGSTFCLDVHADYGCRHSGACCSTGWPIAVESPALAGIEAALAGRRLRLEATAEPEVDPGAILDRSAPRPREAGAVLGRDSRGRCRFLEVRGGNLCAVHRQLGQASLPSACRQFPRVCVLDPRGVQISLSHYCPTAARMLLRGDGDLSVVRDAPAFPPGWGYEGLDAEGDLPPPLCPGVLLDPEGLSAWEALGLRALGDDGSSPEHCVTVLHEAARESRRWRPGRTALADAIARAFRSAGGREPEARSITARLTVRRAVAECAPPEWRDRGPLPVPDAFQRLVRPGWSRYSRAVRRYLAARFFASWSFQLGAGLSTHAASVGAALDVLWVEAARACESRARELDDESLLEALRQSDRLLVHLASPDRLAALFSRAEA
jgi:Fe-S-cluster containining protein